MPETAFETLVGALIGAHGIQGGLKVKLATPTALSLITPPKRASELDPKPSVDVWVGASPNKGSVYKVISAKRHEPREILLVRLAEVNTRDAAEALTGSLLFAPDERRAPLEADEFFVSDIVGLDAVTQQGESLGRVAQVISQPANDVYETDAGALIPAVKEFVVRVDLAARQLIVRSVPGLMPDDQEGADDEAPPPAEAADADALERIQRRRFGSKR